MMLTPLESELLPAPARALPERPALKALGQITLIDPSFGEIMWVQVVSVIIGAGPVPVAQM